MKEPERPPVPVDPNNPERPVDLLVQAVRYLTREAGRWADLAVDARDCSSPYAQSSLVTDLAARLERYNARGLRALQHIAEQLVAEANAAKPKEAKEDGAEKAEADPAVRAGG